MDEHRSLRVSEALREELAEMVGFEMADPRLAGIYVSECAVSPDLRHAHVRVAAEAPVDERTASQALKALDHAANFLRHELAARLNLRRIPELHFSFDAHSEAETRVEVLLKRAKKTRGRS
jgi:ribosome-binding factor A